MIDPNFIEKLGDFLLKAIRLPPRNLIILLLLIALGFQFWLRNVWDDRYEDKIKNIIEKLDSCRNNNMTKDMFWSMKIDSIRREHIHELQDRNKELEKLSKVQDLNNALIKKTIDNLKNTK